jgi:hypothetical protein
MHLGYIMRIWAARSGTLVQAPLGPGDGGHPPHSPR